MSDVIDRAGPSGYMPIPDAPSITEDRRLTAINIAVKLFAADPRVDFKIATQGIERYLRTGSFEDEKS